MGHGMIAYSLPLARYPDTYNGEPLCYAGLAAQKHHYSLYLTCAYQSAADAFSLADAFARAGKKLDMGKSCVRFKSLHDLPLPAIGAFIAATPPDAFIERYEATRATPPAAAKRATAESAAKRSTTKRSAKRSATPRTRPR